MGSVVALLIGVFVGTLFGFFTAALLRAGKSNDEENPTDESEFY